MRSDLTMLGPLREGHPVGKASQGSFLEERHLSGALRKRELDR